MKNFKLSGRIWLTHEGETILGSGKVELLQQIKLLGSLRQAAIHMNMSYRKAWYSVKQMNTFADEDIVLLKRGGKEGGNALLTEYGNSLLQNYQKQQKEFEAFLKKQNS